MSERKRDGAKDGALIEWQPKQASGVPAAPPAREQPGVATGKLPSLLLYIYGVGLPTAVILIELATRLCAESFFDPIPTWGHVALVALVPAVNLAGLVMSDRGMAPPRWLSFAVGMSLTVSAFYALLFLPLMPLAVMAVIFYGIGLLPMGPLLGFVAALTVRARLAKQGHAGWSSGWLVSGVVAGLIGLAGLDLPAAMTRIGLDRAQSADTAMRANGLWLIRNFGSKDQLLRLAYDTERRPGGPLLLLMGLGVSELAEGRFRTSNVTPAQAREVFYRAFGLPFNAQPPPAIRQGWRETWTSFDDFAFDADHGGTAVGQRIKGLDLVSSRIDGSVNGDDATAYVEWIFEFRNTSLLDREARLGIALPPGGVVSRASLWINGEEREAAFGARNQVRAAYQSVAVAQRRDPLLVTTKGVDRVLAQAFPVPRNGGTIKFKLGITAPLDLVSKDTGTLALPAIVERNFGIGEDFAHAVWIESKRPLKGGDSVFEAAALGGDRHRITARLRDTTLAQKRPTIRVERNPDAARVISVRDGLAPVEQRIITETAPARSAVMIVVDGSLAMKGHVQTLIAALKSIPDGSRVGLMIAGTKIARVPVSAWDSAQAERVSAAIRAHDFVGGEDNTPAVADALTALEAEGDAELLWVHGPQPVRFTDTGSLLEQAGQRITRWPTVTLYQVTPGPNELLPDQAWAWGARLAPASGDVTADLEVLFRRALGSEPRIVVARTAVGPTTDGADAGSGHIARLYARDTVVALLMSGGEAARERATVLAAGQQLVTPVSGAVVLETNEQYAAFNLKPVAQGTVPTAPEPHEWALIILASLLLMRMAWQQRARFSGGVA